MDCVHHVFIQAFKPIY